MKNMKIERKVETSGKKTVEIVVDDIYTKISSDEKGKINDEKIEKVVDVITGLSTEVGILHGSSKISLSSGTWIDYIEFPKLESPLSDWKAWFVGAKEKIEESLKEYKKEFEESLEFEI